MNISEEQKRIHEAYVLTTEIKRQEAKLMEEVRLLREIKEKGTYRCAGYNSIEELCTDLYGVFAECVIEMIDETN